MRSVDGVSASRNPEPDVVEHAAVAEEAVVLGDDADVSEPMRRHPPGGALEHVPVVLVGPAEIGVEAGEDPEQRALAGSAPPGDRYGARVGSFRGLRRLGERRGRVVRGRGLETLTDWRRGASWRRASSPAVTPLARCAGTGWSCREAATPRRSHSV